MSDQECIVCGKARFLILEEGKDPYCLSPLICSEACAVEELDQDENTVMSIMYMTGWRWHFESIDCGRLYDYQNRAKEGTVHYMHPVD